MSTTQPSLSVYGGGDEEDGGGPREPLSLTLPRLKERHGVTTAT
jgi:hypothetical protein